MPGHGDRQRLRALIAHEAVHAWCDMHSVRMDFYDEEAAGYITHVWLLRRRDQGDDLNFGSARANAVTRAATQIDDDNDLTSGMLLTRAHVEDLRAAIGAIDTYRRLAAQFPNTEHHNGLIRRSPEPCGILGCW